MKTEISRLSLITEYESAPDNALFTQETVAAIRGCSLATTERDRWAGTGVPFLKINRSVRYRKADIRTWIEKYQSVQSTAQAQYAATLINQTA